MNSTFKKKGGRRRESYINDLGIERDIQIQIEKLSLMGVDCFRS